MDAVAHAAGWHAGFLAVLPAVQTHARIQFRRLPASEREESVQEAVASACVSYRLLAARGRLRDARPGTISDFAVKHVRSGRHVGGSQDGARDVMSPALCRRRGVCVVSYDANPCGTGGEGWKQLLVSSRRDCVADLAAFRVDFAQWLNTLTRRDRGIIAAFAEGETTSAVAGCFSVSAARVSQLRRRYEQLWNVFHGETSTHDFRQSDRQRL